MDQQIDTQVVVVGAGIVGAHTALSCAKRGLSVLVIDNIAEQKLNYKVGESLLVFSNMFLRTISELDEFNETCFPKDGVWFTYGMEDRTSFEDTSEWALESTLCPELRAGFKDKLLARAMLDDVQIVRPEAEARMHETLRRHPNVKMLETARVTDVAIDRQGGTHEVTWQSRSTQTKGSVRTRWIIDCTGRNRLLAKRLGHAVEQAEMDADQFRTTAIWGQFTAAKDERFPENWCHYMPDGKRLRRDRNTLHLWGKGYWIWVIRLSEDRLSWGFTFDQRFPPPGASYKEQFWNIVSRYPLFKDVVCEENLLQFHVFKSCQVMTDTFVSPHRYGLVGDAASVIDAYYSQGVSLNLVTSFHIANVIEADIKSGVLDRTYIDRINRHLRQDWKMMRNIVKVKYTSAIEDGRFFMLTHLLDMVAFVGIAGARHRLVQWLSRTGGDTSNETPALKELREGLGRDLFFSYNPWLSPEQKQELQGKLQAVIAERARARLSQGVRVPNLRAIVQTPSGLLKLWRLVSKARKSFVDLSPDSLEKVPNWMRLTGEEKRTPLLEVAGPMMMTLFFLAYGYDGASNQWLKLSSNVKRRLGLGVAERTSLWDDRAREPVTLQRDGHEANGAQPVSVIRATSAENHAPAEPAVA